MSMQRDDFTDLPSPSAETINSHVSRARTLRSEAVYGALRLRHLSEPAGLVVAMPARRTERDVDAVELPVCARRCA